MASTWWEFYGPYAEYHDGSTSFRKRTPRISPTWRDGGGLRRTMSIGTRSTERRYVRGWGVHAGWCDLVRWQESMGAQRQGGDCGWFLPLPLIAFLFASNTSRGVREASDGRRSWFSPLARTVHLDYQYRNRRDNDQRGRRSLAKMPQGNCGVTADMNSFR